MQARVVWIKAGRNRFDPPTSIPHCGRVRVSPTVLDGQLHGLPAQPQDAHPQPALRVENQADGLIA